MSETISVGMVLGINEAEIGEKAGDIKRVYSSEPLTIRMLEEINSAGDKEITGDAKRIYSFGGLKVTMDRAIGTAADDEKAGDIERIYTPGGLRVKMHRLINTAVDNEVCGDFIRICFVTLAHMTENFTIILTVEQPYGIPWMQNEIVHSAWCWKITRKDGMVLGFTSHDEDITYDGLVYKAATGFAPTAVSTSGDMAVDNLDAEGMETQDKKERRLEGLF